MLTIVGADAQAVRAGTRRAFAEPIPLGPALFHAAVSIERVETVLPDASIHRIEHVELDRSGKAGVLRRNRCRQPELAALRDENPIRRFGEHAGVAAERKSWRGKRLMPATHDVVRTCANRPLV